jgi:hypothetical protein
MDGTHRGNFSARAAKVDLPRFAFTYSGQQDAGKSRTGMGIITFHRTGSAITGFTGFCLDADEETRHILIGTRIVDPSVLEALEQPERRFGTAWRLAKPLLREANGQQNA